MERNDITYRLDTSGFHALDQVLDCTLGGLVATFGENIRRWGPAEARPHKIRAFNTSLLPTAA